jgi:two-component sensor histidine kinase
MGSLRACVHDLRNLFAVVASAKSLLERPLDDNKRRLVLDVLGRVALEGKVVSDALLAGGPEDRECGSDGAAELQGLVPIVEALERPGLAIEFSIERDFSWILMAPSEFRAVVLELVTNAAAAGAHRIAIRAARRSYRYWLMVADDEPGFASRSPAAPAGLHGTGMRRLAAAVEAAHGKIRIRSKKGRGSAVGLIFPIMRIVTGSGEFPADRSRRAG